MTITVAKKKRNMPVSAIGGKAGVWINWNNQTAVPQFKAAES